MRCRIGSLGLKVLVLVFTLVLGVSLTRIIRNTHHPRTSCRRASDAASRRAGPTVIPKVNFCELMAAPELYEGKLLELPVKPRGQAMLLRDETCIKGDPKFDIEFVGEDLPLPESGGEAFLHGVEISLVGKFRKSPFAGDSAKYQFQIIQVTELRLFIPPQESRN